MSRRALILATVSFILLIWCTSITLGTFYTIQIIRHLFLAKLPFHHDFVFDKCQSADDGFPSGFCSSEIPTGFKAGGSNFRVVVTLTLPESDENHEKSTNAISICSSPTVCKNNMPVSLRYRTPIHRGVRAIFLAIPLLFGLVDEYQRLSISMVLPASKSLTIRMQKDWQISNANIEIIPYFRWVPPFYLLLIITVLWYGCLFCAFIAYRTFERLRNSIAQAIFPQEANLLSEPPSPTVIVEEIEENEGTKEQADKLGDKEIEYSFTSSSREPVSMIGSNSGTTTMSSERVDSKERGGFRRRKGYAGSPPDCLLNGKY